MRPFQFALQARAGTDALAAHVRAALETRPGAVLVSLDGRSAYDSMSRAAFLGKLREVAPELLLFVRFFYGSPCTYCWWDAAGRCRDVCQGEGCEQGDALAPALYALRRHDALRQACDALHPDDTLVAFLDELYVITSPSRARAALDETVRAVADRCGIASNLSKTRVIAATAGPAPPGIAELGDDVWRGDKPDAQRGVVVLGSPVGHPAFVQGWAEERLRTEQLLLDQLPTLLDLQCAWLLLLLCASPRANHAIRTMPPSASAAYARGHDDAIWATLQTMLGGVGDREAVQARLLAALPGALGGLGLQSAQLTAPAASPGRTHCPPYTHACPGARLVTSSFSKPSWGKPRTASGKRRMLVVSCWTGVGATAPRGVRSWKALAPPSQRTPAQETGRTVGNTMLFGPSPNTLANVWSCRPCRPVPVRCFALRRGRMPEHGSQLYPAKTPPPSRRKRCKSL